jgi:prolyl-tRNA synthetase
MKYSHLIFKTTKTVSSDLHSKNARLLTQAGYIHQEVAGVYTFLPLGLRVLGKIEKIIREEMDKIGVEVLMTSLAPQSKWEQTGRLHTVDVLMKTVGANEKALQKSDTSYVLGSTHEEIVTPLVQEFARSYRDLPVGVYQIQTKFRGEPRAKSGLLRCREFRMKDLYSFHVSEADLKAYYEKAKEAYWSVFNRLGLGESTLLALASGGDFTPDFSHEFQVVCDAGEDTLFQAVEAGITFNKEVAPAQAPALNDQEELRERQDVEGVGIIGVEELAAYLKIPVEKTTKTILFETDTGEVVAVAVRGGYEINEEKVIKILGCKKLHLASAETVRKVTGAEVGYAGVLNLPKEVRVIFDESTKNRRNFECGANKTNYHSININWGRDLEVPEQFYDIKIAKEGDAYPETGEQYLVHKACEVGNIFPLNTKFSQAFDYTFTDENGQQQPVYMGCYGIGSSRVMGVLVEKFADEKGLIWPKQVAPFQVHLVSLGGGEEKAAALYQELLNQGIEVLWDDRTETAGTKFADADLIGIPIRLVVSKKTGDQVEWKERTADKAELLSVAEVTQRLKG